MKTFLLSLANNVQNHKYSITQKSLNHTNSDIKLFINVKIVANLLTTIKNTSSTLKRYTRKAINNTTVISVRSLSSKKKTLIDMLASGIQIILNMLAKNVSRYLKVIQP